MQSTLEGSGSSMCHKYVNVFGGVSLCSTRQTSCWTRTLGLRLVQVAARARSWVPRKSVPVLKARGREHRLVGYHAATTCTKAPQR